MDTPRYTPYRPRVLDFLGLRAAGGYRIKIYSIVCDDGPPRAERFEAKLRDVLADLPQPATALGRPGVGFAILHRGQTGDYLILAWWDRENELPLRVFVRDSQGWRTAEGGESVCVWDLRVIWSEREAYVATMLTEGSTGIEGYLSAVATGHA